jgi:hypothetical protein
MWWALEEERSCDPCSNPTSFSGFDVNALCSAMGLDLSGVEIVRIDRRPVDCSMAQNKARTKQISTLASFEFCQLCLYASYCSTTDHVDAIFTRQNPGVLSIRLKIHESFFTIHPSVHRHWRMYFHSLYAPHSLHAPLLVLFVLLSNLS